VYGFNVSVPEHVSAVAKSSKVQVLLHNVIYKLIANIKEKLSEKVLPLDVEEQMGEWVILNEQWMVFENCWL